MLVLWLDELKSTSQVLAHYHILCKFLYIHTIISISGSHGDDTGSRRQNLRDRRAVRGSVKNRRVVIYIQHIEVHSDCAGLPTTILSLRCQNIVLLSLVV